MTKSAAIAEWRRFGFLPFVAALGLSTAGLHLYGMGPLIEPLQREFGWSRAQIMGGAALVSLVVVLAGLPIGTLIDRWGPRRTGLLGLSLVGVAVALLSTATGSIANWFVLWGVIAVCAAFVQPPVWVAAVATRFEAARGSALAVALCGGSFGIFAQSLISALLVQAFGWRGAFLGLGLGWVLVVLPLVFLFFRGAGDHHRVARPTTPTDVDTSQGLTLSEALRSRDFYTLTAASALFALAIYGIVVHFVPIVTDASTSPMEAAVAASLIGVFSLVGRLITGAALDRMPAPMVGAVAFLIPIPACLLLLNGLGGSPIAGDYGHFVAAAMLGLSMGAEMDVVIYLAASRFGLKRFGTIQSVIFGATALGGMCGPLLAGVVFDTFGGYGPHLLAVIPPMALSSILVAFVRQARSTVHAAPASD